MRVLFWNTNKNKDINPTICELIIENKISMVALAEYEASAEELIDELLSQYGIQMIRYPSLCERIVLIGSIDNVELRFDNSHVTIQVINGHDIFCCVHLNSKIYSDNENYREILIEQLIREISAIEKDLNTDSTLIVGDFNINPYDASCISARYFHGMPIYEEAKRKRRTIAGSEYSMFYNPMWRLLGDTKKPYGTYYHNSNNVVSTYWNIYDQVIIRPSLRDRFVDESLEIVTETQTRYLLDSAGHPDKSISDHLPIVFELQEEFNNGEKA